jgi:hypothetical protein
LTVEGFFGVSENEIGVLESKEGDQLQNKKQKQTRGKKQKGGFEVGRTC